MDNTLELKGKITKWLDQANWGVINFYPDSDFSAAPRKAFLHISNVISAEKPQMGSRVMFVLGPPRSATELPAALRVRVIVSAEAV